MLHLAYITLFFLLKNAKAEWTQILITYHEYTQNWEALENVYIYKLL